MIHALGGGSAGGAARSWGDSYFETLQPLGTRVACMVDGEPCIAQAGLSRWSLVGPSVVAQGYVAANPMPSGSVATEWLSTNSFLTIKGTDIDGDNKEARGFSVPLFDPGLPSQVGWGRLRIGAFSVFGGEAAYTDIKVALCNGGDASGPTLDNGPVTWVSATGIVAPASPSGSIPGAGPICDWLEIPSTPTARGICVRLKRGAGSHSYCVCGPQANYPSGVGMSRMLAGDPNLASNDSWATGAGESFGIFPAIYVEYDQLTLPVVRLEVFGDSQAQGYVNAGSGGKGPFGHCHDIWAEATSHPLIVTTNLAKQGNGTSAISDRMRYYSQVFGTKAALRQTQSTNDDDGTTDATTAVVAASRAAFDSDSAWLTARGVGLIPFAGPGKSGWAEGAYGRYRGFYALNNWGTTYPDTLDYVDGVVTDPAANGAPYPQYTDDTQHFNPSGQRAWAEELAPALVALLEGYGYAL